MEEMRLYILKQSLVKNIPGKNHFMAAEAPTQRTKPERSLEEGKETEERKRSHQPIRKVSIKSPRAQLAYFHKSEAGRA